MVGRVPYVLVIIWQREEWGVGVRQWRYARVGCSSRVTGSAVFKEVRCPGVVEVGGE